MRPYTAPPRRETCVYCHDRLPLRFLVLGDLDEWKCRSLAACGRRVAREAKANLGR
jgi:hypothetical protein